jgi:MoxR-like ATPase
LANQHAIVLGAPGWGKTAVGRALAAQLAPAPEAVTFVRVDPSTPPEVVRGACDPAPLLAGRLEPVTSGTPYGPGCRLAILDEVFRANEMMFDALLDVLDRQDAAPGHPDSVWTTANFVAAGERVEALRDRFALWLWLSPDTLDVSELVGTHLSANGQGSLMVSGVIPDWQTLEDTRRARPPCPQSRFRSTHRVCKSIVAGMGYPQRKGIGRI